MSFLRRKPKAPDMPPPLTLWIWAYDTTGRHEEGRFVTRVFFRELLDLPDIVGQDSGNITFPFSAIPEVLLVRPHSTYMAVEWQINSLLNADAVLGKIVGTTVMVLGTRFKWQEQPAIVWLNGQRDLEILRVSEKIPGEDKYYTDNFRWRIGL